MNNEAPTTTLEVENNTQQQATNESIVLPDDQVKSSELQVTTDISSSQAPPPHAIATITTTTSSNKDNVETPCSLSTPTTKRVNFSEEPFPNSSQHQQQQQIQANGNSQHHNHVETHKPTTATVATRNKQINLDEIVDDNTHEKENKRERFASVMDQCFNFLCAFGCKRGQRDLETGSMKSRGPWLYRNYAPIHIFYIIFCGFFFGTIFYILELSNPKTNIPYIDALVMSFASVCLSGFLTQPITNITVSSQVCLFFAIVSGGLTLTCLPITLLKIRRCRLRMFALREAELIKRQLEKEQQQEGTMVELREVSNSQELISLEDSTTNEKPLPRSNSIPLPPPIKPLTLWENIKDIFVPNGDPFPLTDVECSAMCWVTVVTAILVLVIVAIGFFILGGVFATYYNEDKYMHGKDPFWLGLFIAVSAFNNCGLTLLDENLSNFVHDWSICFTVGVLVMLGNVLFPLILRYILVLIYKCSTKRKVVFKYILEKHHHLSPYVFPGLQTTIYGVVTLLLLVFGIVVTLASDWNSPRLVGQSISTRVLVAFFHPMSSRTGGFNSVDLFTLSYPTLVAYALMMRIKPQMACSLRENAYKIVDMVRYLNEEEKSVVETATLSTFNPKLAPMGKIKSTHSIVSSDIDVGTVKELGKVEDGKSLISAVDQKDEVIYIKLQKEPSEEEQKAMEELEEEEKSVYGYSLSTMKPYLRSSSYSSVVPPLDKATLPQVPFPVKSRRFAKKLWNLLVKCVKDFWFYLTTMLSTNNMWMIIIIFAISIAENDKLKNDPAHYSLFYILFEVISAFANSGLTVGMEGSALAYCAFWTSFSKVMICIVMIMGRHRGFYGTMIDMEEESYVQDFSKQSEFLERREILKQYKRKLKKLRKMKAKLEQ
ncbi:hypothetical protein C9374_005014 [Naegleria lovaniensis]|uniref:Uncharacterized protein n=1 Tax=Naegleria lovaniensis TaxID=51637 RepID=A0AA88GRK5_NAELO|nr:uncharacterized protein C9374_005014 [Naegleria lovaniensis]KAG2383047.1 hypothetical protein C9374_005014 [Naegleria lovaniensis]